MILENIDYEEIAHVRWKYSVIKQFESETRIKGYDIDHKYFQLLPHGTMIIKRGYACDGCSGPTMDDDTNMHAGFLHDGLYNLLRMGKLGHKKSDFSRNRKLADLTFRDQLKKDGMGFIRRNYYYYAVRYFGKKHALPG